MGVTDYPVLKTVQNEANKLWFYGLVASIILSLYQLFLSSTGVSASQERSSSSPNSNTGSDKENNTAAANEKTSNPRSNTHSTTSSKTSAIWEAIVIDACDLFLPGSSLGWLPVSTLVVGIAGTTSTTVAGKQIWLRLRREQLQREQEQALIKAAKATVAGEKKKA
jgi:cytoskeletal protein RodZ